MGLIIGLKTTRNHLFKELLPPVVGPQTRLITVQNGLGSVEALQKNYTTMHKPLKNKPNARRPRSEDGADLEVLTLLAAHHEGEAVASDVMLPGEAR